MEHNILYSYCNNTFLVEKEMAKLMTTPFTPAEIFCSYADADAPFLDQLEKHLSVLQQEGLITTWSKRQIVGGTDWQVELDRHLNVASLIFLLVSPDFLASNGQSGGELQQILQRPEANDVVVMPILLRACDWESTPLNDLQIVPRNKKPIASWRNRDEAWAAVVQEIRRVLRKLLSSDKQPGSNRSSASQPVQEQQKTRHPAPFPGIWNVPYRYSFFFTGRESLVERLFTNFTPEHPSDVVPIQALSGLGGLGKTQTAVEYAYRYRRHYRAVLWMRAETEEELLAGFTSAAELLKRPAAHVQQTQDVLASMQEWFQNTTNWLLILDNADQIALIEPFLPLSARGHILLTTRATAVRSIAEPMPLTPLTPDDGALCLLRRAAYLSGTQQLSDASPASVEAARELSQLMAGLPLALEQAGAYIETTGRSVTGYLDLYRPYRPEIQRYQYGEVPNYRYPVAFTWNLAREIVQEEYPAALELLHLCAFLAPEGIPYEIFTRSAHLLGPTLELALAKPLALDRMVALLLKHSLIKKEVDRETDISRLIIHPVLQEVLKDDMDLQTQYLLTQRVVGAVAHALSFVTWQVIQTHARRCLSLIKHWKLASPEADLIRQHFAAERL